MPIINTTCLLAGTAFASQAPGTFTHKPAQRKPYPCAGCQFYFCSRGMFTPSRDDVRQFFTSAWQKHRTNAVLSPLETMAVEIILLHPEYHDILEDPDKAHADYTVAQGKTNPFLHMSMHLAIKEQLSIDHPPGIRVAHQHLLTTRNAHDAIHIIMEALGEVIWEAQRLNKPLDNERYLELIRRYATRH